MKLEVRRISFGYTRKTTVLNDISFTLAPEEMTVLAGVNGCGKSTLLKIMAGILAPQNGDVYLNDVPLTAIPPRQRATMLAFMGQSPEIPAGFTVEETVLCGRYPYAEPRAVSRDIINGIMHDTGISHLAGRRLAELSGGERQKVFLALALAQQPQILLLDEPFSALDPAAVRELFTLLLRMKTQYQLTIVMVLHDISRALHYADRIIGLKGGRVRFDATPENSIPHLAPLYDLPDDAVSMQMCFV